LKESLTALLDDALGSLRDLLPIILVIGAFQLFVFRTPVEGFWSMATGAVLVVAGLTFFIFGLRVALFPFAFVLGFGTTVAEPALIAIAAEAAEVAAEANAIGSSDEDKSNYAFGLRFTVALAVGAALVIGVMRILADWSLPLMIIAGYFLVIIVTTMAPKEIVAVAYDSGGVTTSTVTVPLVTALGVGLASSLRGRSPLTDGFGLIAFASLTPILFVLVYGIIV
jgi:hypothetical protein